MKTGFITVMIVDDEPEIGRGINDSVDWAALGMKVAAICTDSAEALARALSLNPDIIVSDIYMPGINGLDLADRLRLEGCNSRFIFISAYSEVEYFKHAFKVNAVDYILKPIDINELITVLAAQNMEIRKQRGEGVAKLPDPNTGNPASSVVRRVSAYVRENLGSRLTISVISKACYLSPNYLCYLFRKETGLTINEYITAQRMRKACELLRQNRKIYVSEVAAHVGYHDAAYFSRQFKISIGCTPQEYQEETP